MGYRTAIFSKESLGVFLKLFPNTAMKVLIVLAAVTALCAGGTIPVNPGDNSHYVEGESRYIWMPDGEGLPHLVDLQEPVNEEFVEARNGAHNQYWLFTRQNPNNAQFLTDGDIESVRKSNYQDTRDLIVIVHGWKNNGSTPINPQITSAFLDTQDVNVIVVDWSVVAGGTYTSAVRAVPSVGQFLGNFLVWLINNAGGNWNNVHLIGHSLGAHVVGNAGRTAGRRASRVTGLDPAGPEWILNPNAFNKDDGIYVEAIHTDGGKLGFFNPIAKADFYANGGKNPQPGCMLSLCSHIRAYELMAATIRDNHLNGRGCSTINQVGDPEQCTGGTEMMGNGIISKRASGIFALKTRAKYPY